MDSREKTWRKESHVIVHFQPKSDIFFADLHLLLYYCNLIIAYLWK
jgi:hypothetical protein